jgi:PAS domain S-box-containing protein
MTKPSRSHIGWPEASAETRNFAANSSRHAQLLPRGLAPAFPFDTAPAAPFLGAHFRFIERVADASPVLIYVFDLVSSRTLYCNQALTSVLGYTQDDLRRMDFSLTRTLIHPDDRSLIAAIPDRFATATDHDAIEYEYRLRHANGEWRWLAVREVVFLRDESGAPCQVLGAVIDVTDRKLAELALLQSQERYDLASAAGRVVVWDHDLVTGQGQTKPPLSDLLGLGRGGDDMCADWLACIHPDDRDRVRGHAARQFDAAAPRDADGNTPLPEIEYRTIGRDGAVFWLADRGTVLRRPDGEPHRIVGTVTDITERKRAEDELRTLSVSLLRAQDEERRRIASDLHDGVAQDLAAIAVNLLCIARLCPDLPKEARSLLAATQRLGEQALHELRTLTYLLHPPLLENAGLAAAVRDYAHGFAKRTGIAVDLDEVDTVGVLTRETETALYRVVQECLVNVQRHSGSDSAAILLSATTDGIVLEVRDRGRGMRIRGTGERAGDAGQVGVGIASMIERVRHLGGHLEIRSSPGGTTVRARLPDLVTPRSSGAS